MKYLSLLLACLLVSCKAEINTDSDEVPQLKGIVYSSYCQKVFKVRERDDRLTEKQELPEGTTESQAKATKQSDERVLFVSYKMQENSEGDISLTCYLSDGGREYRNENNYRYNSRVQQRNTCDIVYDLDNPSYGTFTISYFGGGGIIDYSDQEDDRVFSLNFRSSECTELSN